MIGKIIGAVAGAKAADHVRGVNEPGGALLGLGAAAMARRYGFKGVLAALAGGYVLKRYKDSQAKRPRKSPKSPKVRPSAT